MMISTALPAELGNYSSIGNMRLIPTKEVIFVTITWKQAEMLYNMTSAGIDIGPYIISQGRVKC